MGVLNNELLASVYQRHVPQIIVIWPLVWRHEIGGDWYIRAVFE